jgi:hypothetical protein
MAASNGGIVLLFRSTGIRLARFTDEQTCRIFFPRCSLVFQQRILKAGGDSAAKSNSTG